MTSKEKIGTLRSALEATAKSLVLVCDQVKTARPQNLIVGAIDVVIGTAAKALEATKPRSMMTKEEKERTRAAKRFGKRQDKMVSWLKLDGIGKGKKGIQKSDGKKVEFMSDPFTSDSGIRIAVRYQDGTAHAGADALAFRPDFEALAAPDTSRATVTKAHRKSTVAALHTTTR